MYHLIFTPKNLTKYSLVDLLRTFGVQEVMRTGTIAMSRGVSFEGESITSSLTRDVS